MTFTVAITGKPNVGKSSLFNKLNGRRLAIVNDMPGVTRDSKDFTADIDGHLVKFIDTAGWEDKDSILSKKMVEQTLKAVSRADLVLLMLDARNGITPDDIQFGGIVRKSGKPCVIIINKSESKINILENEIYKFGFGEPIYISAAHGKGIADLFEKVISHKTKFYHEQEEENPEDDQLKLTIVGRPNVGKSTLFNAILGFERAITSDIAGTTRDAINHYLTYKDTDIELIDTAGLRKKANVNEIIEELSTAESINAIRRSHIAFLVVAADQPLEKQDLAIARIAIQEGKPLILVINKCDLIKNFREFEEEIEYLVADNLSEVVGLPIVYISALKQQGIDKIFDKALEVDQKWKMNISTGKLNSWLCNATTHYIPPLANNGRRIRIKYMTQTRVKPPTFNFYCNIPEDLPESYNKYLRNSLRKEFDLQGIPLRMIFHKNKNPYKNR